MLAKILDQIKNSTIAKLIIFLSFTILLLICLLVVSNFYAMQVVRKQVSSSYKSMVLYFVQDMDSHLNDVTNYLSNISTGDSDFRSLIYTGTDETDGDYEFSKYNLYYRLTQDIILYKPLDYYFYYSINRDDLMLVSSGGTMPQQDETVRLYIHTSFRQIGLSGHPYNDHWTVFNVYGEKYLFRFLKEDNIYIGACIRVSELLHPLNEHNLGGYNVNLLTGPNLSSEIKKESDGSISLLWKRPLIIMVPSKMGNYSVEIRIPWNELYDKLASMQKRIIFIILCLIMLIPVVFYVVYEILLLPIKKIVLVMRKIQYGEVDVRMPDMKRSNEFQSITIAFNQMMDQMQQFRINIYEEKLKLLKLEKQCIQLQMNPHFFLNSLNTIFLLSKKNDTKSIGQVTINLIGYFRNIFQDDKEKILLDEEISRVDNYVKIQRLRLGGKIELDVEIPENLRGIFVPPMILLTFVENSIKYSTDFSTLLKIRIIAWKCSKDGVQFLNLTVSDNGIGFAPDLLEDLNEGKTIRKGDREHIGINNVVTRMKLLYGEKATVHFENDDEGGSVVAVKLPIDNLPSEGEIL